MKKRLLLAFMAMSAAVSGYALEQGEFVYTPQGRFQITGANMNANNAFQDLTGWTVVSASTEKTLADNFNVNANGYAEGFNSVASLDANAGEGMYYKFEPSDAGATYVVSYKMKGAVAVSIRKITTEVSTNLVKVEGNSDNTFGGTNDVLVCNTGEELTEDWQTFNYAIVGDGTPRTYFISFTGMATNIEIADVQIAPAMQFADLRKRDAMLEKLNAYRNCYNWDAALLADLGYDEAIANLQAVGDETGQAELDELLSTSQEIVSEFVKANMDDYLAGNTANYFGIKESSGNLQKQNNIGDWTVFPGGRGFWSNGAYPDMGHYQQSSKWCGGSPDNPMGVSLQKSLSAGSYVFAIEGNAATREPKKQCWTLDEGTKTAYGVAYIVKVNGEEVDTIASVVKDLQPIEYTPFFVTAKITEDATYEFGFKAYCKETHKNLTNGSVVYVKDASIWGKNENIYNQAQLGYEADVREQITTGRDALTKAAEYLANADYFWGKADLQDSVTVTEPKIAAFEAMSQDDIIATYDADTYVKENRTKTAEEGLLVFRVYDEAVKGILAANKKFLAINDTLNSLQTSIDAAEAVLALRLYDVATGKDALRTAIDNVKALQTQMKAAQYSEENAAAIKAANEELAAAVELFKTTIPASAIATVVDIDFEQAAVLNEETQTYSISGAAGAMEFTHFSTVAPEGEDAPYQQGHWSNGEQKWKGYLRIGNGDGTVAFNPVAEGKEDLGTSILKVSCDFYIQGLSGRSVGFFLKNEADSTLAALYRNYYNNEDTENTFGADMSKVWAKSGGSYNDASPADAEEPTTTVIEKTSFEVIMDYGTQTMYCNISSPNGSTTSTPVAFTGIPAKFVLSCNYDNKFATRRCWFNNLKIQRIGAGEATGISEVNAAAKVKAPTKVLKNGRIIINGKYAINGMLVK